MKPLAYPLLTDENVHPEVAAALRRQGKDVVTTVELGLGGRPDTVVLTRAVTERRVVLTHDSDFGLLAVNAGQPLVGLIYLRPGHIRVAYTLQSIAAIETVVSAVDVGFIIVAEHRAGQVRVRLRASIAPFTA